MPSGLPELPPPPDISAQSLRWVSALWTSFPSPVETSVPLLLAGACGVFGGQGAPAQGTGPAGQVVEACYRSGHHRLPCLARVRPLNCSGCVPVWAGLTPPRWPLGRTLRDTPTGKEKMHFELENWRSVDHHRGCGCQPCSAAKGHSPQAPGTGGVEIEVGRDEVPYGVSLLARRPNGHQCRRLLVSTAASGPGLSALVSLSTVCCEVVRFCKTSWYR